MNFFGEGRRREPERSPLFILLFVLKLAHARITGGGRREERKKCPRMEGIRKGARTCAKATRVVAIKM